MIPRNLVCGIRSRGRLELESGRSTPLTRVDAGFSHDPKHALVDCRKRSGFYEQLERQDLRQV